MRSLLIDEGVDRGVEFNAGRARYNWSVGNVAGPANVADSLAASVVVRTGDAGPECPFWQGPVRVGGAS